MVRTIPNAGDTPETAVVILDAQTTREGIAAEYAHLETIYGVRDVDWKLHSQALVPANDRYYDILTIEVGPDNLHHMCFDITDFFGKA